MLNSGHNTAQNIARQMFRSTTVAGQIWCLTLSRSTHAAKMTLWPDSSRILAMSGYKFSYGLVCFNVINVIISIYFEVSYALLLSEYEFVLFMHNFTFVWNLSCAEYCFDVELFYYVNWGSAPKYQRSSLLHYLLC